VAAEVHVILAGDIGGTKTHLALYELRDGELKLLSDRIYPTREFPSLEAVCESFLSGCPESVALPDAACFGVPGPIIGGVSHAAHVPWRIEEKALAAALPIRSLRLINDLEATARGVPYLHPEDTVVLQRGEPIDPITRGNIAVIAAGTGLGEAGLIALGDGSYIAIASEGGQCDFAPRGINQGEQDDQIALTRFIAAEFGHASYERVLSGPGLFNIYRFLRSRIDPDQDDPELEWLAERMAREDPAAVIGEVGGARRDRRCERALEMFVAIYGAEAANLALKFMATGGVYIAGGIAPKILASLESGGFIRAFNDKGHLAGVLRRIEVRVILNQAAARTVTLIGAARAAIELLRL